MTDRLFPANLEGATVLEVGCGAGFACIEAKRRGAGRVVAVDPDDERLGAGAGTARAQNLQIEFLRGGIEDCAELGGFDYVLCREPQPFFGRDPVGAIHKLLDLTKRRLVLELEDVDLKIVKYSRKTARRARLGLWRPVFIWPPRRRRPGLLTVDSHGKFLMTSNWIKNLLRAQRHDVESIEIVDSDRPHRYFALATMRRLKLLSLVAGPAGIGKSRLARTLLPMDAALKRLAGLSDGAGWQTIGDVALDEGKELKADRLVVEYNIWRPVERDWDGFDADPALSIARAAETKKVCILVASKEVAIDRLRTRKRGASLSGGKVEWLAREYSFPGRYRSRYERWVSYCKANGFEINYLDATAGDVRAVSEDEAMRIVS